MKIFKKIFKNKFLVVLSIICLITITCISLASATDINATVEENNTQENLVIDNVEKINNSTYVDDLSDDEKAQIDNILQKHGLNRDMYKKPVIYKINNTYEFEKIAKDINSENKIDDLIILEFKSKGYDFIANFGDYLLNPNSKMLILEGNNCFISYYNFNEDGDEEDWYTPHHFLNIDKDEKVIMENMRIAGFNGAVTNHGDLTTSNCKFYFGEGIYSDENSTLRLYESEFNGDGYFNIAKSATVDMRNCTIAYVQSETYEEYLTWGVYGIRLKDYENGTVIHVASVEDLKRASLFIWDKQITKKNKLIKIVFDNNDVYKIDPWFDYNLLHPTCNTLVIEGNGATIQLNNFDEKNQYEYRNEYHFITVDEGVYVYMHGLTVQFFNTAVVNFGHFKSDHCAFNDNKLEYIFFEDCGGAIKNYGTAEIQYCQFINNYAKIGGAIYTKDGSYLTLRDNYYDGNVGYGDDGEVIKYGYSDVFCESVSAYENAHIYGDDYWYVYKPIRYQRF